MNERDIDLLIEEALTSWRPRTPTGEILPHPAWADLPPAQRTRLYDETLGARRMEQVLDPRGLSRTARAILERLGRR